MERVTTHEGIVIRQEKTTYISQCCSNTKSNGFLLTTAIFSSLLEKRNCYIWWDGRKHPFQGSKAHTFKFHT